MRRVLLMHSVNDEITDHRIARIKHSPTLQSLEVRHIFPIELTESQRMKDPYSLMDEVMANSFDSNSFKQRLHAQLDDFNPDILIVHAGFVFERFPREIIEGLQGVRESHPTLRLGIQERGRWVLEDQGLKANIFENSAEVTTLIKQLF